MKLKNIPFISFAPLLCLTLIGGHIVVASDLVPLDYNNSMQKRTFNTYTSPDIDAEESMFLKYMDRMYPHMNGSLGAKPVIFLGPTGVGKSTTICSLLFGKLDMMEKQIHDKLLDETYTEKFIGIKNSGGIEYPKIGHEQFSSCTLFPSSYLLKKHNLNLCDFAGLFDSRSQNEQKNQAQRLVIALNSKHMIDNTESDNVRAIVYLMTEASLTENRGKTMQEMMFMLSKMFYDPFYFAHSIFFGFTKANEYSERKLIEILRTIAKYKLKLEEEVENNGQSDKISDLIQFLKIMLEEHKSNFFLVDPLQQASSQKIIQSIQKARGFKKENIKFVATNQTHEYGCRLFDETSQRGLEIIDSCKESPKKIRKKKEEIAEEKKKLSDRELKKQTEQLNPWQTADSYVENIENEKNQNNALLQQKKQEINDLKQRIEYLDSGVLEEVAKKTFYKKNMNLKRPFFGKNYRKRDFPLHNVECSYTRVRKTYKEDKGGFYSEKQDKQAGTYQPNYWCYEEGGTNLNVTFLASRRIKFTNELSTKKDSLKQKEEENIQLKREIEKLEDRLTIVKDFQIIQKGNIKERKDIIIEFLDKDIKKIKTEIKEETLEKEKEIRYLIKNRALFIEKEKIFNQITSLHAYLDIKQGATVLFSKIYKNLGDNIKAKCYMQLKLQKKADLLLAGYLRGPCKQKGTDFFKIYQCIFPYSYPSLLLICSPDDVI